MWLKFLKHVTGKLTSSSTISWSTSLRYISALAKVDKLLGMDSTGYKLASLTFPFEDIRSPDRSLGLDSPYLPPSVKPSFLIHFETYYMTYYMTYI